MKEKPRRKKKYSLSGQCAFTGGGNGETETVRRELREKNDKSNKACGMGFGGIPTVDFGATWSTLRVASPSSLPLVLLSASCNIVFAMIYRNGVNIKA